MKGTWDKGGKDTEGKNKRKKENDGIKYKSFQSFYTSRLQIRTVS